jgi:hypothetical protein
VDVVVAVNVAVSAAELLSVTDVGDRLHVTGLVAFDSEVVTAQLRSTVPVNELEGVTVIVEVLPEVAPGLLTLIEPLLERVKLELEGPFQKPLQPAMSTGPISSNFAHPLNLMYSP